MTMVPNPSLSTLAGEGFLWAWKLLREVEDAAGGGCVWI